MGRPIISVIMLCYNHEEWLDEALDSVLNDPYTDIEIIFCDNGSSDNTLEKAKLFFKASSRPYKLIVHKKGLPLNQILNQAIGKAQGDLVAFVPGDDVAIKGRFERQVSFFQKNSNLQVLYSNGRNLIGTAITDRVHGQDIADAFQAGPRDVLNMLFHKRGIQIQGMMIKRNLLNNIGGFDESVIAEDWVLNIKIFQHLTQRDQYYYLDEDTFLYRRHPAGLHRQYKRHSELIFEVINKYFPHDIKKQALADNYYERAKIGFRNYGRNHWFLATRYLMRSLWYGFDRGRLKKGSIMSILAIFNRPIPKKIRWKSLIGKNKTN